MEQSIVKKYKQQIINCFDVDDFVVNMLEGEVYRDRLPLSLTIRYPFLFHALLAIVSNIVYPLKGLTRKVVASDEEFLFVSCPDTAFRTKTIGLITGNLKFSIIYLPNFHIPTALHYYKFFKKEGINVFFPTVRLKHVYKAWRKIKTLVKLSEGLNDNYESRKFISVLSSYAIYDEVVKEYMRGVGCFKGKWILEHQKFYFMASVAKLHQKRIPSTMLQHGVFFKPVYDFIPLLCDKVLCCSEREKNIYLENGIESDRVEVLGAPLQTLQLIHNTSISNKHYDLLIMMTFINENNKEFTKKVLKYIKENYKNVLVRMRPRSRKNDEILLADVLEGMALSDVGAPIEDDILACEKVVSFSVDANIEVTKLHKPFVYIWDGEDKELVKQLRCATAETFEEEIHKLMTQKFYSTFNESQYKDILGETDVNVLREKFIEYIKR